MIIRFKDPAHLRELHCRFIEDCVNVLQVDDDFRLKQHAGVCEGVEDAADLRPNTFIGNRREQPLALRPHRLEARAPLLSRRESYRFCRRAHSEGGWSPWHDQASIPRSYESEPSAWFRSTRLTTRRNGRRSDRWLRSWGAASRRCVDGCDKLNATTGSDQD